MALLLDTSVAILLRDGDERVTSRLAQTPGSSTLSVVSRVELEGGVYRDPAEAPARRLRLDRMLAELELLPFGAAEAEVYGRVVAQCGFSRSRILERMIAASAITASLPLATLNPRDFAEIPGLVVQDWLG